MRLSDLFRYDTSYDLPAIPMRSVPHHIFDLLDIDVTNLVYERVEDEVEELTSPSDNGVAGRLYQFNWSMYEAVRASDR